MKDTVKVKARCNAITRRFEIDRASSWDDLKLQVSEFDRDICIWISYYKIPVTSSDLSLTSVCLNSFFVQIKKLFDVQDFTLKYIDDEDELVSLCTKAAFISGRKHAYHRIMKE